MQQIKYFETGIQQEAQEKQQEEKVKKRMDLDYWRHHYYCCWHKKFVLDDYSLSQTLLIRQITYRPYRFFAMHQLLTYLTALGRRRRRKKMTLID
jgi:hypothetical protein